MKDLKKIKLPFIVFLTGACVLVIEIVATRILSPYFGNTIFTVSSVISIVLAALSVGYYYGGKYADKHPTETVFYSLITLSGFAVIILHLLTIYLLPVIGNKLSINLGPIVSALLLFFLPSFILGTLSPFAIKLQEKNFPEKGIGSISGEIFFWSTSGSIFGSLFSGFVMIPHFGIHHIVQTVAVVLILLGGIPLAKKGMLKKSSHKILFFCVIVIFLFDIYHTEKNNTLYTYDGIYEKISVSDGIYKGKPTRFFKQDRSNSGAMFLDSDEMVFDYTKYYSIYPVFQTQTNTALVIGGGIYSIPKALLKDLPNISVDVSEIEPSLFELAKTYFRLEPNERLHNFQTDGRRFLFETKKQYDLIFCDAYYSLYSIPTHLTTVEFFKIAKEKLNTDGIFVANLIGDLSRQEPSFLMSEIKTFQTVFPNSYFFAVTSPNKIGAQNIIAVGYKSEKIIDFTDPKISKHENPIIQSLSEKKINLERFEFSNFTTLTDDFSPVDYFISKVLQKTFTKHESTDGNEKLALIGQQLRYGPRYLSAPGHKNVQKFLLAEMSAITAETKTQSWKYLAADGQTYELTNIIGRLNPNNPKRILLGAHYDSKKFATKDLQQKNEAVPGANDSASGIAVLLELARIISNSKTLPNIGIDIVLFDGEEGEENMDETSSNWKPLGSTYFAEHLTDFYGSTKPSLGIILDMVCDKNLSISKRESGIQNTPDQVTTFWNIAKSIDEFAFNNQVEGEIRDDHTPLNAAGIPSFLVIDFDYPHFHTREDTLDKCSKKSLETVGNATLQYISSIQ